MDKYKIIRFFFNGRKITIRTGLTLEQAQAYCNEKARTRKHGEWFDGYTRQD